MRGLVLAEKPSLMRAIESAYKSGGTFPFTLDFAAFHGHLMRMAMPGDYCDEWGGPWEEKYLPMVPDQFRYLPDDAASVAKIMSKIKAGKYDFLVNACDAEREGEHIFWSFYEANGLKLPVKRLWCSTTLEADLQKALHDLKDASVFQHLREAAAFRAQFDWLTGMNFSRAVSLKVRAKSNIGRVVTPTLKMVVDRELEIRNFVPQNFYEVGVTMQKGEKFPGIVLVPPELKQTRFPNERAANDAKAGLGKTGTVENVVAKRTATKAPTLYSTTELQKDANKYFKFRASKTDSIAQDLYEAGYISYPRTSCRFLPTSMVPEIPNLLKPMEAFPELTAALKLVTPAAITAATSGKDYIDDAKLTDHHALIPTVKKVDPSKLTEAQKKIYLLVAKRLLSIFLPAYTVDSTTVMVDSNGWKIKASGKAVVDPGFSILYTNEKKDVILPPLSKGDQVDITGSSIRKGQTTPPDRYTDKSLLDAMANAGKFVSSAEQRAILREAEGIGTPATRSDILEKLASDKTNLCRIEKGHYYPTDFGMALIDTIKDREITSPAITAKWEKKLRDLQDNGHPEKFKADMLEFIKAETADILEKVSANLRAYQFERLGPCPICGHDVVCGKEYYRCVNYKADKDPCTFIVKRAEVMGTKISVAEMKLMLSGKKTKEKKLKRKDGSEYVAALVIAEGKIVPAFAMENKKPKPINEENIDIKDGLCTCPCCGKGQVFLQRDYYTCTGRNSGCRFLIPKEFCKASISPKDVKDLVAGKTVGPFNFTWKNGGKGVRKLKGAPGMRDGVKTFKLEFVDP